MAKKDKNVLQNIKECISAGFWISLSIVIAFIALLLAIIDNGFNYIWKSTSKYFKMEEK